jgi:general secretion pathway protein G
MLNRRRRFLTVAVTLAILLGISIPVYRTMIRTSREKILQVNLHALREGIAQYTADKKKAPQTLQSLVEAGYFRTLPIDPFTNSDATWKPVIETVAISDGKPEPGITDLQSGSTSVSSNGSTYDTW